MNDSAPARGLLDLIRQWQGNPAFDDAFEDHIRQVREAVSADADADPWLD